MSIYTWIYWVYQTQWLWLSLCYDFDKLEWIGPSIFNMCGDIYISNFLLLINVTRKRSMVECLNPLTFGSLPWIWFGKPLLWKHDWSPCQLHIKAYCQSYILWNISWWIKWKRYTQCWLTLVSISLSSTVQWFILQTRLDVYPRIYSLCLTLKPTR